MEQSAAERPVFAYNTFIQDRWSVITVQWLFHVYFNTELTELQKQTTALNQSSHSKEVLATITRGHIGRYCPWGVSSKALALWCTPTDLFFLHFIISARASNKNHCLHLMEIKAILVTDFRERNLETPQSLGRATLLWCAFTTQVAM